MHSTQNNDFLEKSRQNFLSVMRRQNIMWDLIDANLMEDETEIPKPHKSRKKKNPQIQLETN